FILLVPLVVARRSATVEPAASQLCPFLANLMPEEPRRGLQKPQSLRDDLSSRRQLAQCRSPTVVAGAYATASDASGMSAIPPPRCWGRPASDRHLRSHFHYPPGGDLEIVGGVVGNAGKYDEQAILPARHAGTGGWLERAPRQEERGRHDVEGPAKLARDCQRSRHVRAFHETEP